MDPWSIVEDEVALEGLDGITIPTLWIRLQNTEPKFPLKLDDCTKELIWKSLASNSDLKFYQLPKEREDVVLFDRFQDVDAEKSNDVAQKTSETRKDIYPVHAVPENKDGVQGSCAHFKERTDITKHVRSKSLTLLVNLEEALERYGRKLVVVASQTLRFRALIGSESDPDLVLTDDSYCVLERVGRARWQGELQRDLHGGSFKVDARKFHYLRKSLVRHQLVTMQPHLRRLESGQQQHSILLLLKRFHVNRSTMYEVLMEYISNLSAGLFWFRLSDCALFLQNVNEGTFKRVFKYMRAARLIEFCQYPLEDLDPGAGPCTNKNGSKVLVRCVRLIKPYTKKGIPDDEEDDDEDEEDDAGGRTRAFPSEGRIMERDIMSQAYHLILSSGTKGIPQRDIVFRMNIGKLEARMLCRKLEKDGLIKGFLEDEGRQRTTKFISHNAESNGYIHLLQASKQKKSKKSSRSTHETYRLLRRKNLIVEAVRNFKIIESLHPLQKMINEEEKQSGVSSKCCKKTIVRLIHGLSREGLLKMYTTTVVQDGISKKVDLIVHPSIQPNDDAVKQVIEQVRFKISSSYTAIRLCSTVSCLLSPFFYRFCPSVCNMMKREPESSKKHQRPSLTRNSIRGLSKTFGFQPKMHRLRVVHTYLWYLIYGHPLRHSPACSDSNGQTQTDQNSCDPDAKDPESDEGEELKDKSVPATLFSLLVYISVYVDEDSWKRFVPPVRLHKEYTSGWAMVGDLLLSLPLSIFVQVIQVNYQVDGLEEYLNDPVMQHHLVRMLPARMKRQLLYKRKYIFLFHENLQKLVYMGLLQFGPMEKFKDKDQVFVYLRRNTTIIDTTNAEPHYWLVTESLDKPFERRKYILNTAEDVESYWFDLMCVCLNTPLGTCKHNHKSTLTALPTVGNREACDDGSMPGDGKGAGGLDSEFFAHLKRNWLWTNHLLSVKSVRTQNTNLTCRDIMKCGHFLTHLSWWRVMHTESTVYKLCCLFLCLCNQVAVEPASRNQQVVGGKGQKRKRGKKDVAKAPRKKRKGRPKKRTPAHDEADHKALKMMTRQRVYWSVQEDSLMILCSVVSHLFNSKLKRPFVPHCVVRDLLHAEFEISMDKTSLAVGRRSRYILKNPQALLNYRICLAEVFQDKTLMRLLEENKPTDPDSPEVCFSSFSEYIRLLRQKFSCVLNADDLIMPDTKQQLFSRFKVSAIDDRKKVAGRDTLSSTEDIHVIVLHNLIQSTLAMTNSQMKSSRSFQAFRMYSKYDQELLCKVFIECRKRGLVNRRRVNQPFGPKKNRALPILPMSYQLSQSYYRCFSWRFPQSLCTDAFCFLRTAPASEDPLDVSGMLQFSLFSPGGACVVCISLMSLGLLSVHLSIPKQMVVVDSSLVDNVVSKSFLSSMAALEEEDDEDDDGEDCEGGKKLQVKAHQASHTNYLIMRGYCSPGIGKLVTSTNSYFCKNIIFNFISFVFLFLFFFVFAFLDSPPLDLTKCGPSLLPSILTYSVHSPSSSLPSVEECNRRFIQHRGYTPQDIEACHQIRRSLHEAGESGLDVHDLHEAHIDLQEPQSGRTRSLPQYLQVNTCTACKQDCFNVVFSFLCSPSPDLLPLLHQSSNMLQLQDRLMTSKYRLFLTQLIVTSPFSICHLFFLFPSPTSVPHSANVSFVGRPWRMVDGKLNRPVCKGMLEAILYHVMSRPGITQKTLVEHYKDLLQPMAVLDLMQALIDLGCVTKKTLVKSPKPSLFSRPARQTRSEPKVKTEEPDTVFYEPTVSCCLRLCQVLPNERHWNNCIP
uniref:General transcription factor IIIC subunit 1 n=1 Tax=Stegastes partitus TaxID=144197 RepID=A0A3B4ZLA2_9TELE